MTKDELVAQIKQQTITDDEALRLIELFKQAPKRDQTKNGEPVRLHEEVFTYNEPYLQDHLVLGEQVLLGVTHCSLAIEAVRQAFPSRALAGLRKVLFVEPITLRAGEMAKVSTEYFEEVGRYFFKNSYTKAAGSQPQPNASGELNFTPQTRPVLTDFWAIQAKPDHIIDRAALYGQQQAEAIRHGPTLQSVVQVAQQGTAAVAQLCLSAALLADGHTYDYVHPALLDGALVAGFTGLTELGGEPFIPLFIKEVQLFAPVGATCYSYSNVVTNNGEIVELDCWLCDEEGRALLGLLGFTCKRLRTQPQAAPKTTAPSRNPAVASMAEDRLLSQVTRYLAQKLGRLMGKPGPGDLSQRNFMDLGIASTQLIDLVRELEGDAGIELYPTLLFEYQNLATLAAYLAQEYREPFAKLLQLAPQPAQSAPLPAASAAQRPSLTEPTRAAAARAGNVDEPRGLSTPQEPADRAQENSAAPVAIIGMAGVFPRSPDVQTFWRHLHQQTDLITEIPQDHFDYTPWYDATFQAEDKLYCKWGSFIDNVDKFDASFFNISPREAELMDPQLRYLLQVLYQTAEDAGYGDSIRGSHTGMYVGVCFHDYAEEMMRQGKAIQAHEGTGNAATMLANRPSFLFDLSGPSLSIDTACSSSLFALHYACKALQQGECEIAFAAGVNLLLSSAHYRYFCALGALSPTGRCHTFDERADGYVPGEAVAAVLLKPLARALQDGDQIYGIVKGSAVGHGGYTPSITAPSVNGEARVILAAWQAAGIHPETLGYIEAHGTGTKLGDPVEIAALTKAFQAYNAKPAFCAIGSAKAHIGHTEGAAGITGVIKVLLSMQHGVLPAMPDFATLNPYIPLEQSPFTINPKPVAWPQFKALPRRAGVSSFGFGGAYAHVVIEEYQPATHQQQPSTESGEPQVIVLSAKHAAQLRTLASQLRVDLAERLKQAEQASPTALRSAPSLASIAYTLQTGRAALEERLAFIVTSRAELLERLHQYEQAAPATGPLYQGNINNSQSAASFLGEGTTRDALVKTVMAQRGVEQLAQWWVAGVAIDWRLLHGATPPQRISLPTYPFAQERYWFRPQQTSAQQGGLRPVPAATAATPAIAAPLFFAGQPGEFTYRLSPHAHPLLREHTVFGHAILSTDSLLELAYSAATTYLQTEQLKFEQLYLHKPLVCLADQVTTASLSFGKQGAHVTFALTSQEEGAGQAFAKHMTGAVSVQQAPPVMQQAYKQVLTDFSHHVTQAELFGPRYPLQVGDFFRSLQEIYVAGQRAVGILQLAAAAQPTKAQFLLSPSIVDSLLGTVLYLAHHCSTDAVAAGLDTTFIPIYIDQVSMAKPLTDAAYYGYAQIVQQADDLIQFDVDLIDQQDQVVLRLTGLAEKRVTLADIERSLAKTPPTAAHPPAHTAPRALILAEMRKLLSQTLLMPEEKIKDTANFFELGFDSILGMEFIQKLARHFALPLKGTDLYEHNTLTLLAEHIAQHATLQFEQLAPSQHAANEAPRHQLAVQPSPSAEAAAQTMTFPQNPERQSVEPAVNATAPHQQERNGKHQDIAIIGLACRFPEAENPAAFWQQIAAGHYLITDIPPARQAAWQDSTGIYCPKGSFIQGIDQFDPAFFNISPREAEAMDPQLRKLLEVAWEAIEDSGQVLKGSHTGVYLGNCFNDYLQLLQAADQLDYQYAGMGNTNSALANRVSYILDLTGPSLTVDTACSSSLVALHLACAALHNGDAEQALVGGVNLSLHPGKYKMFCAMGALSKTGVLRPFDEQADGYIPGEGIAVLLLKPLARALADQNPIYGVIKGTAVRHGGYSGGPTIPNVAEQTAVMLAAWQNGGIPAHTISYYEAHGTGTRVGDPLEIQAIKQAMAQGSSQRGSCAIGTVKANIGHTEATAGLAGVMKLLLMMKHQLLPALPKLERLNHMIELDGHGLSINQTRQPWVPADKLPRRGGVSAFGIGGTLAHVVLEEYIAPLAKADEPDEAGKPQVIVLSAKDEERLRVYAGKLLAYLAQGTAQSVPDLVPPSSPAAIQATVQALVAEVLGVDRTELEPGQRFAEWGLDVVQLRQLQSRLEEAYGADLPTHLLAATASVAQVADYLARRPAPAAADPAVGQTAGLPTLAQIAYTLQVGREAMESRLAIVATSHAELVARLRHYQTQASGAELIYQGQVKSSQATTGLPAAGAADQAQVQQLVEQRAYAQLAQLWVTGGDIDWRLLYKPTLPLRVALPTYPFATKRYWLGEGRGKAKGTADVKPNAPASLQQRNGKLVLRPLTNSEAFTVDPPQSGALSTAHLPATTTTAGVAALPSAATLNAKIKALLRELLYLEGEIDEEKPFSELGMDSITGVEFVKAINQTFALTLEAVQLYAHPTIQRLTAALVPLVKPGAHVIAAADATAHTGQPTQTTHTRQPHKATGQPAARAPDWTPALKATDVAVIGMAGRFPGAPDLAAYWQLLQAGRCAVGEIPPERWDVTRFYDPDPQTPGKSYSKWGGFLTDIEQFDPLFFNISPAEAKAMDPQQRLVLEVVYHALEDAGYGQRSAARRACGLYVGVMSGNEYSNRLTHQQAAQVMIGNAASILAGRVAYTFDLQGPAIAVDTACSSSLVAVDLACKRLIEQDAEMMVAGGVTLYLTEQPYIAMSKAQMLAPDGLCKSFDQRADGFVPGEGVGFVVLKLLSRALADGDAIYGVIKGSGVNQDGKTNGLTAPNLMAQQELQLAVYRKHGIDPATIHYIETHGTGTKLGDPVEIAALTAAFRAYTAARQYCAIGSVKTNIGHTSAAAGVASLIKVLLALRHGQLPPSLHYQHANEHIDFAETPFYVNTALTPWVAQTSQPRRAAINSFGFSGTNAHVVVEEYAPSATNEESEEGPPQVIVLSARNEERLQAYVQKLLAAWTDAPATPPGSRPRRPALASIAYTLQVGREALAARLAFVVTSHAELLACLRQYPAQTGAAGLLYQGNSKTSQPAATMAGEAEPALIQAALEQRNYVQLAQLWVTGRAIDWRQLHGPTPPRRVALPTYPFAQQRCWVDSPQQQAHAVAQPAPNARLVLANLQEKAPVRTDHGPQLSSKLVLQPTTPLTFPTPEEQEREMLAWLTKLANDEVTVDKVSQVWRAQHG